MTQLPLTRLPRYEFEGAEACLLASQLRVGARSEIRGVRSEVRGYAAFLQNASLFFRVDTQGLHPGLVCVAPLGQGPRGFGSVS